MSARNSILSNIQNNLGSTDVDAIPEFSIQLPLPEYETDLHQSDRGIFVEMLKQVHGSCEMLASPDEIPDSVATIMNNAGNELSAVIADNEILTRLNWGGINVYPRKAIISDSVSVTVAYAGIAETGTIVMISSPHSAVTLNFLPEINIVVLPESRLVATMEQFWPMIQAQPRAINFITGPSKTADIEQTIVYGAHGPKQFHVLLISN